MPGEHRTALVTVTASVLAVGLLALFAMQIANSASEQRRSLDRGLAQRTMLARQFTEDSNRSTFGSMSAHAEAALSGDAPDAASISMTASAMQLKTAILLDEQGRLLQTYPEDHGAIGQTMADEYIDLQPAVKGDPTVSGVVPSTGPGQPIVAFAVPFATPTGRRVYCVGFSVDDTTLGALLENIASLVGQNVYLIDSSGKIVSSNDNIHGDLHAIDPELVRALDSASTGTYLRDGDQISYTSHAITGAPWKVVVTMRSDTLYQPLDAGRWTPWLLFASFALMGAFCIVMLSRLTAQRGEASRAAQIDGLTGLANRRQLDTRLATLAKSNSGEPWALLMIDIDHFKSINDRHGHIRGDDVLRVVATRMHEAVRSIDVVGRWGGDEFMVLLPGATLEEASAVADHIRKRIDATDIDGMTVTASIGYAATDALEGEHDGLLDLADAALYRAKRCGRDRSITLSLEDAFPVIGDLEEVRVRESVLLRENHPVIGDRRVAKDRIIPGDRRLAEDRRVGDRRSAS